MQALQGDSGTEPSTPAGTTVDADFGEYPWQVGVEEEEEFFTVLM